MMKRSCFVLAFSIALAALVQGCSGSGKISDPLELPHASLPEAGSLDASAVLQQTLAAESTEIQSDFEALRRSGGWRKRGYFTALEHEAIAGLLFRFVVNHSALWGSLDRQGGPELDGVAEDERLQSHILVLHAGLVLMDSSASLIAAFMDDPIAIKKLDESFYRYEIPPGSYGVLRRSVTSERRQDLLAAAWHLYEEERVSPDAVLSRLESENPAFAKILVELDGLHAHAAARVATVQKQDAGGPADLDGKLSHTRVAALGRDTTQELGDARYATRSLLFKNVSRIKSPSAHLIRFSPEQKKRLHSLLRPGDVIVTYTAGYISDVFIPGMFKHGITYVGDSGERGAAGLTDSSAPPLSAPVVSRFKANLAFDTFPDGTRADLIEAVAEGVKFSNLDQILDTHINRLLVLRPRLTDAERTEFLAGVFSFVGDPYDFRFDFADASRQVCTEVIYRALDGKSDIHFTLTARAGHPTLSADDVVNYYLSTQQERFDFILYAEEDPAETDHRALLLTGAAGKRRIANLMKPDQS